ncbi:inositol monophosphatase family protein [Neoroseomonas oryzicola]|uniref:ADP-ribosylglycohydrolase family protein n=1 Tax=Neoroseomonas oryzicola TaxID=535904 RepID=A0A9X9WJH6_9PROT|nr:inositol monophosphatase family protein [Neoroseomonas oryzicola]MBR0660486.1 hypothetical protein [Neoroseomonas oryzicola]NKE18254.1 hypothetical protein [Neoroseomonas oryzicola]
MKNIAQDILPQTIEIAQQAGRMLANEFLRTEGPRGNRGHASIDDEIALFLRDRLVDLFPTRWVCEETPHVDEYWPEAPVEPFRTFEWQGVSVCSGDFGFNDRATRDRRMAFAANRGYCWVVDPHDGTSAFLQGYRGTAVSIALLKAGRPVLGVVHAPLPPDRSSDTIAWAEGRAGVIRNGETLPKLLPKRGLQPGDVVFVSQAASGWPTQNAEAVAPARFVALPSIAYRLARVACGDAIAGVSLNGPCSWDYAAGHALLLGAGGTVVDQLGSDVSYTKDGYSQVGQCFGGAIGAAAELAVRNWRLVGRGPREVAEHRPIVPGIADATSLSRAVGCLLGLISGDALGSLVEFQTPKAISASYPAGVQDLADGGTWDTIAGQPTDDGELALALARVLADRSQWCDDAVAAAYANWLASGPFDCGMTTGTAFRAALMAQSGRAAAARAAANAESEANGALMRVAPVGIWARDPAEAARVAREDALLSHPSPVTRSASGAFAAAIAVAIAGGDRDAMHRAAEAEASGSPAIADVLRAAKAGNGVTDAVTNQGWVLHALKNAFHRLWHASSVEAALVATVGMGGDTDTNGAICGALLGAAYGADALPTRWTMQVASCRPIAAFGAMRPRPAAFWPVDLPSLAERLLQQRRIKQGLPA